jgi:hypothetical protein
MKRLLKVIADGVTGRLSADKYIEIRCDNRWGMEDKFMLAVFRAHPTEVGCRALEWTGADLCPWGIVDLLRKHESVPQVFVTKDAYEALEPHLLAPAVPFVLQQSIEQLVPA